MKIFFLVLFIFALLALHCRQLSAQELTQLRIVGKAEFLAGELISREHRDVNGEVCAGFVVVSDLTGLTFKSWNGIVKMNQDPGRSFLFLSPSERVVEVYCLGYEPLKIYLNDIGVRLKSGEVWQVKVTGDKKLDFIPITILAEHPNIIGMKDSSGNMQQFAEIISSTPKDFSFFVGNAPTFFTALSLGACGGILAVANVIPNECVRIQKLFAEGKLEEAKQLQLKIIPLAKAVTTKYSVAGLKFAMDCVGYFGGEPRSPLLSLKENEKEEVKKMVKEFYK